jgi:hypothetical protein
MFNKKYLMITESPINLKSIKAFKDDRKKGGILWLFYRRPKPDEERTEHQSVRLNSFFSP